MPPKFEAVLFDLDGTLADTAPDLGSALNALLRRKGLPEVGMDKIRPVASHGANGLVLLGAGIDKDHPEHARWRADFLAAYEACFTRDTVLFDGVHELIAELMARGIRWGIITNKPHTFTSRLVPVLGFQTAPEVVVSGDTTGEAKPSTKPMLYACAQLGVAPDRCLYVGDAERDIQAGRNAGMRTALAAWGYIGAEEDVEAWGADYRAAAPLEILQWV